MKSKKILSVVLISASLLSIGTTAFASDYITPDSVAQYEVASTNIMEDSVVKNQIQNLMQQVHVANDLSEIGTKVNDSVAQPFSVTTASNLETSTYNLGALHSSSGDNLGNLYVTAATNTITGSSSKYNTRAYGYIFWNQSGTTYRVVGVSGEWNPSNGDTVSRRAANFGPSSGNKTYLDPTSNYFEYIDMTPYEFTPLIDNYELNMEALIRNSNGNTATLETYTSLNGSDWN